MDKRWKRVLAFFTAAALLGSSAVLAAGDEAPAPDDIFQLGSVSEYGEVPIREAQETLTVPGDVVLFSAPAAMGLAEEGDGEADAFDPRDTGLLPAVRAQGTWNTCWAMAAMGAAEADGLKNGLLSTSAADTDLSERHLIYFFSHQADDPLGNSSGDYNINPTYWVRNGGNPVIASMTMANWHGPASEADTASPYDGLSESDSLDGSYAYADALHLRNTYAMDVDTAAGREALKDMIRQYGGAVLCLYYDPSWLFSGSPAAERGDDTEGADATPAPEATPEGGGSLTPLDPSAPPAADGEEGAGPEETEELPEPTEAPLPVQPEETAPAPDETGAEEDAGTDGETETEPESEPEQEPEQETTPPEPEPVGLDGAPEDGEPDAGDTEAADFTVCYYQNSVRNTNHEVLIVGWDDGYPAENFGYSSGGAVPPGNGAWLCRNSNGPDWAGGDGYFWVSYYDASVSASTGGSISGRVTVFQFDSAEDFDHSYEYDGAVVLSYVNDSVSGRGVSTTDADSASRRWYGNVFTAAGNDAPRASESLKAVSTYTYRPGVSYTAEVYTGLTEDGDPTSGTLAAQVSGTFAYAGFHTVALPTPVALEEGSRFGVVFRVGMADDRSIFVPACTTSSNWYSKNESARGESFVSLDGETWLDCQDLKNAPNVRVKAYTDDEAARFPFTDVPSNAWYYGDVEQGWLSYRVNGVTATTYAPGNSATRAQIVAMLRRMAGNPAPTGDCSFDDAAANAWYYDDVRWAEGLGIIKGSDDDNDGVYSFRPDATITRQEFMTILYRYASLRGLDVTGRTDLAAFEDSASVSSWAKEAVSWSVACGLQKGVAGGGKVLLDPRGNVSRAQLAAFINRFADMVDG